MRPRRRCPVCRKLQYNEEAARKLALTVRTTGVRRLSTAQRGYHRTRAYECPAGNGWHIGRAKKGEL